MSKEEPIIQYLKGSPEACPNSRKLAAAPMWIFLTNGGNYDPNLMYGGNRDTRAVYDIRWREQNDDMMRLTSPLQTAILKCVQDETAIPTAEISPRTSQTEPPARGRDT